jgi:pyruvate-formate lyase-activating enzyme
MGLRLISAGLKTANFDTRMIFLPDPDELLHIPQPYSQGYPPAVLDQVCHLCSDVDLVGISVMSNYVGRARALTQVIHDRLSIPVVWGGIHPTVRPAECLAWADIVCVGEGEEASVELVSRMATGQGYTQIPNIWLKEGAGKVIANPVRPLNRSLDDLPLPDYELSQQYILHQGQVVPLTRELLACCLLNAFAGDSRVAYMTCATRGCPYACTYCCNNALAQLYPDWRRVRRRSPEHIIAEINAARKLIPALEAVMFVDSTFLAVSTDGIRRFSRVYKEQVGLPFFIMATPESVTEEKLRYLVEAGLQDVEMGIEAGSRHVQAIFGRPADNARIMAAAHHLNQVRASIPRPRYDLISDNSYETDVDRLETLRLLYRLPRPYLLYVFSLTFYPGTELHRQAQTDGLIQDDEQSIYQKNFVQLEPTYYNFVLWCLHRNLPRWLLWVLIQPLALRALGATDLKWVFRILWKAITAWRIRHARRVRLQWESRLALTG